VTIMDLYEAIETRRSIRKFRSEAIPKEKILRILEAANLAPTAINRQPWNFLIVDRSTLDQMREVMDLSFKERIEEMGRTAMNQRIKDLRIPADESNDKVEGLNEFYRTLGGAPVAVVVYVDKVSDPWQFKNNICDASASIENLILAAWNEGIGSCWMTGPLKKRASEIKAFLGITEDKEIVGIIPIGIAAHIPKSPPKEDVKTKIRWFGPLSISISLMIPLLV
jgi:nitroreductase